jgi:hypothetical protein
MKRDRRLRQLHRDATRIRDEGHGVWQTAIYPREDLVTLLPLADAGDRRAIQVLEALTDLLMAIEAAPTNQPMLCLTCDNAFRHDTPPAALVLTHAYRDDPSHAICHGICATCCRQWSPAERDTAVTDTIRRLLIPDLRRLPPINAPGKA